MTAADLLQLHAECAHTLKLVFEGLLTAAFLMFCYWVAPYVRNPPRR